MNERDPELPDLSREIQFAIQAGRRVKPTSALEQRIFDALDAVDNQGSSIRNDHARRFSLPVVLVMVWGMVATAAGAVAAVVGAIHAVDTAGRPGQPGVMVASRDLAVQIPDDGHVWVDLPVETGRHDADRVLVSFNAPASVAFHVNESDPGGYARECEGYRCVHRWETSASSDDGVMPRVRITEPGRYEFSVTHASSEQHYHERFVVLATR
jgi:hypothetical protein